MVKYARSDFDAAWLRVDLEHENGLAWKNSH